MSSSLTYPLSPERIDESKLALSAEFRKQVGITLFSIVLFFIVYILLVLASIALAIACFYAGVWVIISFPRFITIMLGVGAMCLGVSVIFFLIKFIFAVSKDENPSRVQITQEDQPMVFAFVRKLTEETNTPFPKKIFVSPDVNAAVFYNSSFWSMFLPVRKNLEIGLGLVNSVNVSEFKAVMAHEFGHFSQRSMKLGSFTYNVNRIIYNMLFENNSYTKFLHSWGSVSGYLAFFANITISIAQGIQGILRQMYKVINKSYLSLSREMEFHADAVSASVSGGNNLISALSKLELAQNCYDNAINGANDLLREKKITKNIFDNQLYLFRSAAQDYKLPIKQGLPEVSFEFIESLSKSRINYKNQWASHPSIEERKSHLDKLDMSMQPNETPAWTVFSRPDVLQEQLTTNLYKTVSREEPLEMCDQPEFEKWHSKQKETYNLPEVYKGYYDKRLINTKAWDYRDMNTASNKTFDDIFNESNAQLHARIKSNQSDLEILRAIKAKHIDVKTFDFDGTKYSVDECEEIIKNLENEIAQQEAELNALDKEAFLYFYNQAGENGKSIANAYAEYTDINQVTENYLTISNSIMSIVNGFYTSRMSVQQALTDVVTIKDNYEKELKSDLRKILNMQLITEQSNPKLFNNIQHFLHNDYVYFSDDQFIPEDLNQLVNACLAVSDELNEIRYRKYKKILEEQLEMAPLS